MCISILHNPGDDPNGYETASERWSPVHTVSRPELLRAAQAAASGRALYGTPLFALARLPRAAHTQPRGSRAEAPPAWERAARISSCWTALQARPRRVRRAAPYNFSGCP